MAGLDLLALQPRSVRRVRLLFSKSLAVGAFTSTSFYSVTNNDGAGTSPTVVAALAIPDVPQAVELAVSDDLAPGGAYTVAANAVPALDASTTPTPTSLVLGQPGRPGSPSPELTADDTAAILYGIDLIHQDGDFLEGPNGDLARQSGPENAKQALAAAMLSEGLPHDPSFGAHPREYVDGPAAALAPLTTKIQRTLLQDDRVKRVERVEIQDIDPAHPERAIIEADVQLIGNVAVKVQSAAQVT